MSFTALDVNTRAYGCWSLSLLALILCSLYVYKYELIIHYVVLTVQNVPWNGSLHFLSWKISDKL